MELWFWAAVVGMLFAGISNFIFKIAAKRNYDGSLFSFQGGIVIFIILSLILLFSSEHQIANFVLILTGIAAGALGGLNNILKVKALQCIDSVIYFPLFKLLSPVLAVIIGIVLFQETFTQTEWWGIVLGVTVPLLLISPSESGRQQNLTLGLTIILITASFAAFGSALGKYTVTLIGDVVLTTFLMTTGVLLGSVGAEFFKGGYKRVKKLANFPSDKRFFYLSFLRSVLITIGAALILYAYYLGGPLGIVHTINSMYILIPIVFSIIFYNEHWNLQKALAIILSVASLALLG